MIRKLFCFLSLHEWVDTKRWLFTYGNKDIPYVTGYQCPHCWRRKIERHDEIIIADAENDILSWIADSWNRKSLEKLLSKTVNKEGYYGNQAQ